MIPEEVRKALAETEASDFSGRLVWMDNTPNLGGGSVMPQATSRQIVAPADKSLVPIHLDHSRIINAVTFLRVSPSELVKGATKMQFCLS